LKQQENLLMRGKELNWNLHLNGQWCNIIIE
jgi:hypothetical protein